ncbi:MAG TPA: DUF6434 domain-containing protein [Gordonia sp. (in: high G+C Gram-positive bacteria)]|uniref:DUF6434 domain-containing protein n=1 Tax=unclassified Gordonia (in: high G+C Gram-positive bacteria) TaxID=2657482 RepID=UPI000FB51547|nr:MULTISPECIES: DUF6434 domain-containing protein [unclassified Gordonia (in: high G+C Gram-positive bacteria)]RUP40643.1 MAG: hypothetical protein EKK60_03515 [Gordonia sp. (in: high G+C Gram-positive bacteria)]HNP59052.1 DUF6434 domain-containing protein [Gordonia sp. (in: high G+C Gram-positive bacteria)]HRC52730.1 DUF6434 domain-containing protein [Gordonia sp. (in: high G+C Gram-positive bacteria)]
MPESARPPLTPALPAAEFTRWYWRKDELVAFARTLGIATSGAKELLAQRIAVTLDGSEFIEPAPARRTGGRQLGGDLTESTVIPPGQRCSQVLRAWFVDQVGQQFHFDAAMREFIGSADGTTTLGDALVHWRATRNGGPCEIDAQFEYNRFTRDWHRANPAGSREQLLAEWAAYRGLPIDER